MNKTEKLIVFLLGGVLAWYIFMEMPRQSKARQEAIQAQAQAALQAQSETNAAVVQAAASEKSAASETTEDPKEPAVSKKWVLHDTLLSITNDQEVVTFAANERGVAIKSVTLLGYAQRAGDVSEDNPPVMLDFGDDADFTADNLIMALDGEQLQPNCGNDVSGTIFVNKEWGEGPLNFTALAVSTTNGTKWISNVDTFVD